MPSVRNAFTKCVVSLRLLRFGMAFSGASIRAIGDSGIEVAGELDRIPERLETVYDGDARAGCRPRREKMAHYQ
ncbi:MAG: hypothetical protein OXF79_24405 [Chloroflexi bacterium]|nr:hypothetical protein [Chloroflexota bacterium]